MYFISCCAVRNSVSHGGIRRDYNVDAIRRNVSTTNVVMAVPGVLLLSATELCLECLWLHFDVDY